MAPTPGPMAVTLERLAAVDPWFAAQLGLPAGDDWLLFDELAVEGRLSDWVDELAARHDGHRDVAGSYLGGWLASAAIIVPTAALVLERRLPVPSGPLWVHRHPDGWFDRVAFEHPHVLVTDSDPAADHPDATTVGEHELLAIHARGLVERLSPVLDAVRARTPFGRRGLRGAVTDELASAALWAARAGATDIDAAWRTATALIDALSEQTPWVRVRPRPFPVATAASETLFTVKSTCCLYYKTQPQPPDPCGDSYCTTCPFRDDTSRHERLAAHLQDVEVDPN